jgi:xanthine dehydrogenase accessory factor
MTYDVMQHTRKLRELLDSQAPFATITLLDIRGSAPQIAGAKAIVTSSGIEAGTVGGGKIEAAAIVHAQRLLSDESGTSCELVTWNLQTDIGMTCGGEVKLFFEIHNDIDWPIAVFGAGHIAQSLVPLLVQLHCRVTCLDTRAAWLAKLPDHPKLEKRCVDPLCDAVAEQPANTFFVLMTKGHATDLPVLTEILTTRDAPYVGVIGSPQKASVLRRDLAAQNVTAEKIESFFCPMGVPLGNNTPAEISISIVAQLIQQRDRLGILKHKVKDF